MESGEDLYKKALDKEQSFFKIFYDDYTYEEIGTMYKTAGDRFKINKNWNGAVLSYLSAIRLYIKTNRLYDTIEIYEIVTNIYSKHLNNIPNAINTIEAGIDKSIKLNKLDIIANLYKILANLHEQNNDPVKAITVYGLAYDIYDNMKHHKLDAKHCLVRVADLYCITEQYNHALDKYKELVQLSKHYRSQYIDEFIIFKLLLCLLVEEDLVGAKKWFEQHILTKPNSSKFFKQLFTALENQDKGGFENSVNMHNLMNPLDSTDSLLISKIRSVWFNNTLDNTNNDTELTTSKTIPDITDDWT